MRTEANTKILQQIADTKIKEKLMKNSWKMGIPQFKNLFPFSCPILLSLELWPGCIGG